MSTKIHRVKAKGKTGVRYYYYAWRKGPRFWVADNLPVDLMDPPRGFGEALEQARRNVREHEARSRKRSVRLLIDKFEGSGEFAQLAERTRETYSLYLRQVDAEFGADDPLIFDADEIVEDIITWRDAMATQGKLRAADNRVKILGRLLQYGIQLRWLRTNPTANIKRLYSSDRSDIIFTPDEMKLIFEGDGADIPPCPPHIADIFTLAFFSGARRKDAVAIPLSADKGLELSWYTSKSRSKTEAIVPILPELRVMLDRRRARNVNATTILLNSRNQPWTVSGYNQMTRDRLDVCGIKGKNMHDTRGTLATLLCREGFSDEVVAEILGWGDGKDRVARIRRKYVNRARMVRDQITRLTRNK